MTNQAVPEGIFDDRANRDAVVREKLIDALTPGFAPEFDPQEAERAGAFAEDALSERDAMDSAVDLPGALKPMAAKEA